MRTISTASLQKLTQKTGTEPVCLVEVEWQPGVTMLYGDKQITEDVNGRIVSISSFDDILNISKNGTSQNITVTLDDSDGAMKELFNNVDIHKKRVTIYQWFTGIPLSDKFVLFSGVIASPITWKEGDRTLTFTVISKTTDIEVGFSPEEGQFPNLPEGLVGQTWPLVFGTVMKIPAMRIDEIPYKDGTGDAPSESVTTSDHGIEDPSLAPHIDDQDRQAAYASQLAQVYFIGYLQASHTARRLGELDDLADISEGKGTFSGLAKQYLAQGNKYLLESQKIKKRVTALNTVLLKQKSFNKNTIDVTNGENFVQGVERTVKIGDGIYRGMFLGNQFHITESQHPALERYEQMESIQPDSGDPPVYAARDSFFWNPAGQRLILAVIAGDESSQPEYIRYIVSATIQVTVNVVYAYRTIEGVKQLSIVPNNLYSVVQVDFGTLPVTMIVLPNALSSLTDDNGKSLGWDDEIYTSVRSPIGPNIVDIIVWLIETYTGHAIDIPSFTEVRELVDPYPAHFAITDRPNAINLIQDIAYQSRCIVWLKNNIFHIKYLSKKEAPIATITESNIIEQSLEVSYTETEDLTTKVKALWKPDLQKSNANMIILRYNIAFYGLHEVTKNYFIYNMQQLVEKSAVFWLIRDANTFKRLVCKVPIKFLNIETLDTVTLDFTNSFISNGPIDCIVESAQLDTANYEITLTLWVPVRAGEMTEYVFAFPGSLTIENIWPTDNDISVGRAGGGKDVPFNNEVTLPTSGTPSVDKPMTGDSGNGGSLHVTTRPHTWGTDPQYFSDASNVAPEITQRIDDTVVRSVKSQKPAGTKTYQLHKAIVKNQPITSGSFTTCFPAKVLSGGGPGRGPYTIEVYMQGVENNSTKVENVYQLQLNSDDTIPGDTWCIANRLVYQDAADETQVVWYIQVPVWL